MTKYLYVIQIDAGGKFPQRVVFKTEKDALKVIKKGTYQGCRVVTKKPEIFGQWR
jgi:hypothetical protein